MSLKVNEFFCFCCKSLNISPFFQMSTKIKHLFGYQGHKWLWCDCEIPDWIVSSHSQLTDSLSVLTSGDDPLEADDVGMVKLAQDSRFAQERAPLFVRAAAPQRLDGHRQLTLTGQLQAAAAHLTIITCRVWRGVGGTNLLTSTITTAF